MSTYLKFTPSHTITNEYTEPCRNCYASVTYHKDEALVDLTVNNDKVVKRSQPYIICPCCGKKMNISFTNTALC